MKPIILYLLILSLSLSLCACSAGSSPETQPSTPSASTTVATPTSTTRTTSTAAPGTSALPTTILPSSTVTFPVTTVPPVTTTAPAVTVPPSVTTTAPAVTIPPSVTVPSPTTPPPTTTVPPPVATQPTPTVTPSAPTEPVTQPPLVDIPDFAFLLSTPHGTKLRVGENLQLNYSYTGADDALFFLVDDSSVAIVSGNGIVTGISQGAVYIEVYILINENYILWDWLCLFVVGPEESTAPDPLAFSFLVPNGVKLQAGTSSSVPYAFDGSADLLKFEIEDPTIASVSGDGVLTGLTPGKVTLHAFVWNGTEYVYQDFLIFYVVAPAGPQPDDTVVPGERFTLNWEEASWTAAYLNWPAYQTALKNSDGTPATVYYNLYRAEKADGPFYLDCEKWEDTEAGISGLEMRVANYFKVRAYVVCDGVATPAAESQVVCVLVGDINEDVHTSSKDWNFNQTQMEEARVIAKSIADSIMADASLTSDLERVAKAAKVVIDYAAKADYTTSGPYYNTPYGVFIAGEQSCAGCVRALGLILEYMGFQWGHVNPNQWTHQWCVVYDVDGKTAFADGSWVGVAGYGSWIDGQPYEYIQGVGLQRYDGLRPF